MLPAGEMWSVVMKSPRNASARASAIGAAGSGSAPMPSKYGARRTYVESASHANVSDGSLPSCCHAASPSYRPREPSSYSSCVANFARSSATSSFVGQMSTRCTGVPSARLPSSAVVRSTSMVPASEYAITVAGAPR